MWRERPEPFYTVQNASSCSLQPYLERLGQPERSPPVVGERLGQSERSPQVVGERLGQPERPPPVVGEPLGQSERSPQAVGEPLDTFWGVSARAAVLGALAGGVGDGGVRRRGLVEVARHRGQLVLSADGRA